MSNLERPDRTPTGEEETPHERRDRGYRNLDDDLAKSELYDLENPSAVEEEDVFTPKNVPAATLITLLRIYDLLSVIIMEEHPEYVSVLQHHAEGGIAGPPPFFVPEGMDISGPMPQPPVTKDGNYAVDPTPAQANAAHANGYSNGHATVEPQENGLPSNDAPNAVEVGTGQAGTMDLPSDVSTTAEDDDPHEADHHHPENEISQEEFDARMKAAKEVELDVDLDRDEHTPESFGTSST